MKNINEILKKKNDKKIRKIDRKFIVINNGKLKKKKHL